MTREGTVRCRRILALVCGTLAAAALVHPDASRADPDAPPGGRAVVLTREDCARLRAPTAAAVDYAPGVDVEGRPVAPADLPRGTVNPALATVEIEVELGGFGRRWRPFARPAGIIVGRIGFGPDGAILLNGEPLAAADRERLAAACREEGLKPR
jgi:hypothetical protein